MSDREPEKRGYEEEEQPEKVGGAIGGATLGSVGGAMALGALGPLGGIVAILASYAGGWWAGRGFIRSLKELDDVDEHLRETHTGVGGGRPWEETRHAYQLGYLAGRNPRREDPDFASAERELRRAWSEAHREVEESLAWDEVRDSVKRGWEVGRSRA